MANNVEGAVMPRGRTYLSGNPGRTVASSQKADVEGTYHDFRDFIAPTGSGMRTRRSNRWVTCILVRNVSAGVLLPGFTVTWKSGYRGLQVDGYSDVGGERCAGVVDEFLPSSGVPVNDLFWLVVKGPVLMKTALEANANNVISLDDRLYALTAVTSGATTAGRVVTWALTATSTGTTNGTLTQDILNHFGTAMSAKTTANTNADILVDCNFGM